MNKYEATIKLGSSGLQTVTVRADNWNHAKLLLERQYGKENVLNVHQVQSG